MCLLAWNYFLKALIRNVVVRQGSREANDDSRVMGEEWGHCKSLEKKLIDLKKKGWLLRKTSPKFYNNVSSWVNVSKEKPSSALFLLLADFFYLFFFENNLESSIKEATSDQFFTGD